MSRARLVILGIGFGLAVSLAAPAQTAYTVRTVNMRAGPSAEYELVGKIPAGTAVEVGGCVDGYSWCDVGVGPDRGWVSAQYLEYPYQGRRVVIYSNGPYIGLPIVPFAVGAYWGQYYVGRPWYGRRAYWEAHPYYSHHTVVAHTAPHVHAAPHATHVAPAPHPHAASAPHAHAAPAPHAHAHAAPAPHAHEPHPH